MRIALATESARNSRPRTGDRLFWCLAAVDLDLTPIRND